MVGVHTLTAEAASVSLSGAVTVPLRCSLGADAGIISQRVAVTTQFHHLLMTPNDEPLTDSKAGSSDAGVPTGTGPASPSETVLPSSLQWATSRLKLKR